ncbi:MAG: response regulator [Desulfobacteraceae bacterium]|nr:response regulator [Desulfobacteraceae bacterium]
MEHTLLLVDDEKAITRSLQRLFRRQGYTIVTAESGKEGLEKLQELTHPVSLIISDQRMPEMNGAQFLEKAKDLFPDAIRYLLTGYSDVGAVIQAVNKGEIHRYLTKPWNDDDLLLHVRQSLEHYELVMENKRLTSLTIQQNKSLAELNGNLEKKVQERTKEVYERNKALQTINSMLENSFKDSIKLLVSMVEMLNPGLGKCMRKVASLARQTAQTMKQSAKDLDTIEMAGMIHDIGLLGVPEDIWCKDVKQMTDEQFQIYSEHPIIASIILENIEKMANVGELVLYHHEHVNGTGFPNGLRGNQIPLGSKILLAVSDYCNITETWPRDMQKLMNMVRRKFEPEVWKSMAIDDGPEPIIENAAEQKLFQGAKRKYDIEVVSALLRTVKKNNNIPITYTMELSSLAAGMTLMQDLRLNDGRLLLTKGSVLKPASVQSIQSIGERAMIPGKVSVSIPGNPD